MDTHDETAVSYLAGWLIGDWLAYELTHEQNRGFTSQQADIYANSMVRTSARDEDQDQLLLLIRQHHCKTSRMCGSLRRRGREILLNYPHFGEDSAPRIQTQTTSCRANRDALQR